MEKITDSLIKDVEHCIQKYGLTLVLEEIANCAKKRGEFVEHAVWWNVAAYSLKGVATMLKQTW